MIKIKTFTSALRMFHVHNELTALDAEVNDFLQKNKIQKLCPLMIALQAITGIPWGLFVLLLMKNRVGKVFVFVWIVERRASSLYREYLSNDLI